ncbi:MAG: sialidase family protein [Candidatus Omnitrophota bacterium]
MKKLFVYTTAALAALVLFPNFIGAQTLTWDETNAARIEQNIGDVYTPQIVTSGNTVAAVWVQQIGAGYSHLYSNYSTDGGETWSDTQLIEAAAGDAFNPRIAISGDMVVAVWQQYDGDYYSIYSNYGTIDGDGAVVWDSANAGPIESNDYNASNPRIAIFGDADGDTVVAVWEKEDENSSWPNFIYSNYATITGGVPDWKTAQQISSVEGSWYEPQIAISGDTVVAVWRGSTGGNANIYSNYSTDGGESWSSIQTVDNQSNPAYGGPQIAISGDTAVAVWRQYDGSAINIYSNYATIDGAGAVAWDPANTSIIENNYYGAFFDPQIAVSGNTVAAVWQQSDGSYDRVYFNYATISSEGIPVWSSDQLVEYDTEQYASLPRVSISGDNVAVVWVKNDGNSYDRIYSNYATIDDDGAIIWDTTTVDTVSNGDGGSDYPQIAISGDNVVAVWRQNVAGSSPSYIYSNHAVVAADIMTGDYGSLPVGPLAAGISAFLVWWKRRKRF